MTADDAAWWWSPLARIPSTMNWLATRRRAADSWRRSWLVLDRSRGEYGLGLKAEKTWLIESAVSPTGTKRSVESGSWTRSTF